MYTEHQIYASFSEVTKRWKRVAKKGDSNNDDDGDAEENNRRTNIAPK